jgi:D-xylose transport system permease protein
MTTMAKATPITASSRSESIAGRKWRETFALSEMGVYYALILLFVVLAVVTTAMGKTNYLSLMNVSNVLYQSSLTGIMTVAMTVILISGNFDLSVASVAALAGGLLINLSNSIGFAPAAAVAMAASVAIGVFNGSIVQFVGINAFIVTLGTLTAVRGLALIYTGGRSVIAKSEAAKEAMMAFESGQVPVGVPLLVIGVLLIAGGAWRLYGDLRRDRGLLPAPVMAMTGGLLLAILAAANRFDISVEKPVVYMVVFTAVVWWTLNSTNLGRRLYAVGSNPEAARLSGINVVRYKMAAFVLCSATAGFARSSRPPSWVAPPSSEARAAWCSRSPARSSCSRSPTASTSPTSALTTRASSRGWS